MAKKIYPNALVALMNKEIDLEADTILAYLVNPASYTYAATHDTLTDLPVGARLANFTLANKAVSVLTTGVGKGILDADDGVFSSVASGPTNCVVVIYDQTADKLLCFIDNDPVTPNGNNINMAFSAAEDKVFSLANVA